MTGFCIHLGAHHPEALRARGATGVAQHQQGYVAQGLLEAQGAYMVHTRCSGHDDQRGELEVSRLLILRRARMGTTVPLPTLKYRSIS